MHTIPAMVLAILLAVLSSAGLHAQQEAPLWQRSVWQSTPVRSVGISPDGRYVAAAVTQDSTGYVTVRDADNGEELYTLGTYPVVARAVTFLRDGSLAVFTSSGMHSRAAGYIFSLSIHAPENGRVLREHTFTDTAMELHQRTLPAWPVPDSARLSLSSSHGATLCAGLALDLQINPNQLPPGSPPSFLRYGRLLQIDKTTGNMLALDDTGFTAAVRATAISSDASLIAAVRSQYSGPDILELWNTGGKKPFATIPGLSAPPLVFSSDNVLFAGASVWNGGDTLQPLPVREPTGLVFLPEDDRFLLSVFDNPDSCAALFDTRLHRYVYDYTGYSAGLLAVAVSADGRRFVSGGRDGSVAVWSIPEEFAPVTAVQEQSSGLLLAVSPHPADKEAVIRYTLPAAGHTRITVSDLTGRVVVRFDGIQEAGGYSIPLADTSPAPGLYICTLRHNVTVVSIPVILRR